MTSRTSSWSSTNNTLTPSSGESCTTDHPMATSASPDSAQSPIASFAHILPQYAARPTKSVQT
jgi:hypothetical protein